MIGGSTTIGTARWRIVLLAVAIFLVQPAPDCEARTLSLYSSWPSVKLTPLSSAVIERFHIPAVHDGYTVNPSSVSARFRMKPDDDDDIAAVNIGINGTWLYDTYAYFTSPVLEWYDVTAAYQADGYIELKVVCVPIRSLSSGYPSDFILEQMWLTVTYSGADISPPSGSISAISQNPDGADHRDVIVSMSASDNSGNPFQFRHREDDHTEWSAWLPFSGSLAYRTMGAAGRRTLSVAFRDAAGNESAPVSGSFILDDGLPPALVGLQVRDHHSMDVSYSEIMHDTVTDTSFYNLSGPGRGTFPQNPDRVEVLSDAHTATLCRLHWNAPDIDTVNGQTVSITVISAEDYFGTPMTTSMTVSHVHGGVASHPHVAGFAVDSGREATVTFSEPVNDTALYPGAYVLVDGVGTLAASPSSVSRLAPASCRLEWPVGEGDMVKDADVTLEVSGVADLNGNLVDETGMRFTAYAAGQPQLPELVECSVPTSNVVRVVFSEPVNWRVATGEAFTASLQGIGTLAPHPDVLEPVDETSADLHWLTGEMRLLGTIGIQAVGIVDLSGHAMDASPVVTSTDSARAEPPIPVTLTNLTERGVTVVFSEPILPDSVARTCFAIDGSAAGSLAMNPDLAWMPDRVSVRLEWNQGEMRLGGDLGVLVSNVFDLAGNPLGTDRPPTLDGAGIGTPPELTAATVVDPFTVDITYSEPMAAAVGVPENYTLSGSGQGLLEAHPAEVAPLAGTSFRLSWPRAAAGMASGGDVTIAVANVTDLAGNELLQPWVTSPGGGIGAAFGVASLSVVSPTGMEVRFSRAVDDSALDPARYALFGGIGTLAAQPDQVARQADDTVLLTWNAGEMLPGGVIGINVSGVSSADGESLGARHMRIVLNAGIGIAPALVSTAVSGLRAVDVAFSEPMAQNAAAVANYALTGPGAGTLSATPDSVAWLGASTVGLAWTDGEMRAGGDIEIRVVGTVTDRQGYTLGPPRSMRHAGGGQGVAPILEQARNVAADTIEVLFSEATRDDALDPRSFAIAGPGRGTRAEHPAAVSLEESGWYALTWPDGEFVDAAALTVTATGMTDLAGNPVGAPNAQSLTIGTWDNHPTLTSLTVLSGAAMRVEYSEAMDESAEIPANYAVGGAGIGTLAATPTSVVRVDASTFELRWGRDQGDMLQDGDIRVSVSNAHDLAGNPTPAGEHVEHLGGGLPQPPSLTATVPAAGGTLIPTSAPWVDLTFSEPVIWAPDASLLLGGDAGADAVAGEPQHLGGQTWRVPLESLQLGTLELALSTSAVQDSAGWSPATEVQWSVMVWTQQDVTVDAFEDFETGDFDSFPWTGTRVIYAGGADTNGGTYCAHLNKNQAGSSWGYESLQITREVSTGNIRYWRRTDGENSSYGWYAFYVDGARQELSSADLPAGTQTVPVKGGSRTFRWDVASMHEFHSRLYLDDIEFPDEPIQVERILPDADSPLAAATAQFTVEFNRIPTGVAADNLVLTGDAAAGASVGTPVQVDEITWRYPVSGLVSGVLGVRLPAGTVTDSHGNVLSELRPTESPSPPCRYKGFARSPSVQSRDRSSTTIDVC